MLYLLLCQTAVAAEIVSRWTDSNGQVHYGDHPPLHEIDSHSQLVIEDTFDESAYNAAVQRYSLYEKEQKAMEKLRRKRLKEQRALHRDVPLSESDKYDLYMDRQDELKREELDRKRARRADSRRKWRLDCYDPANAGKKACR
jgi:alpha-galactosidase/6-phospho-beta-glucosidase family protein